MSGDPFPDVPATLKSERRWLVWRAEPNPKDPAKPRKVPYQALRPHVGASSTSPPTWCSYTQALRTLGSPGDMSGLGFVLGDGYAGVDLDHCRHPVTGEIDGWARVVVADLNSYAEVSPSGTGVHVLVRGSKPDGACRYGPVEMYDAGRYFTVTGQHVDGTPLTVGERTAELAVVHARLLRDARPPPPLIPFSGTPGARRVANPDDAALLEQARAARNGAKFSLLFDSGDLSGHDGDHSAADLALCNLLLYWTAGDLGRADALFRGSALMRAKWEEKRGAQTYGERTLATAAENSRGYAGAAHPLRAQGSAGGRKYLNARAAFEREMRSTA